MQYPFGPVSHSTAVDARPVGGLHSPGASAFDGDTTPQTGTAAENGPGGGRLGEQRIPGEGTLLLFVGEPDFSGTPGCGPCAAVSPGPRKRIGRAILSEPVFGFFATELDEDLVVAVGPNTLTTGTGARYMYTAW